MAAISAKDVKELRDKTGAGMMDCKKALQENDGDQEKAIAYLRKKASPRRVKSPVASPLKDSLIATSTSVVKLVCWSKSTVKQIL